MPYPPGITSAQYRAKFDSDEEALWERYRDEVAGNYDTVRAAVVGEIVATFDDLALTYDEDVVKSMVAAVDLDALFRQAVSVAGERMNCWPSWETWREQQIQGAIEAAQDSASGGAL